MASLLVAWVFGRFLNRYLTRPPPENPHKGKILAAYKTILWLIYWTLFIIAFVPAVAFQWGDDVVWRCSKIIYPWVFTMVNGINAGVSMTIILVSCFVDI